MAADDRPLAVLDIGKSNSKIVLLDPRDGRELARATHANRSVPNGPFRALDLACVERWMLDTLEALPGRARIGAIVPVAHGAACAMLDDAGRLLLAPDYEDPAFDRDAAAYARLRDPFEATLSPCLPLGLNLGRQIHAVATRLPALFAAVATILPLPQYWAWVLSGVAATEVTSLGCHTDLWRPAEARWSALATDAGWIRLFPQPRRAADILGPLRPAVAARTGLPPDCAVLCGIHDSNASWYRHRVRREADDRFSVISSGTWTVVLSSGTRADRLRADRDMLANVDADGALVGTARFMGGREYEAVAGTDAPLPDDAGLDRALASGAIVRPAFAAGGQFIGQTGRITGDAALDRVARAALATFYVALLAAHALDTLGAAGDTIVDGPLALNPLFARLLATIRPASPVLVGRAGAGSAGGALALHLGRGAPAVALRRAEPWHPPDRIAAAAATWRAAWDLSSTSSRSDRSP